MKKPKLVLCDWCNSGEAGVSGDMSEPIPACTRVSFTNMDGVLLDSVSLCSCCTKRGITFNGRVADCKE